MKEAEWTNRWGARWGEVKALRAERPSVYQRLLKARATAGQAWTEEEVSAFLEKVKPIAQAAKP